MGNHARLMLLGTSLKELAVPEFLIEIELEVYKRETPKEKRDSSRSKIEE